MNFRSTTWLLKKIEHARELGLIKDFTISNSCEIDSFLTIYFHKNTPMDTKNRLMQHIKLSYDDIVKLSFQKHNGVLIIQYVDWEIIPNKIAF